MTANPPKVRRGEIWFADVPGQRLVANFDNVLLIARTQLLRRLGRAGADTMAAACRALAIATGCEAR